MTDAVLSPPWRCFVAMVAAQRQTEVSLRRAAILLSNLDAENRRRLLSHLPGPQAARLRAAAASLVDVDPLEVRRVVDAFVGRISVEQSRLGAENTKVGASQRNVGEELDVAGGQKLVGKEVGEGAGPAKTLQFLSQVSDQTLLRIVRAEHPQTVAIVLGALSSEQGAKLLRELPLAVRTAAMRRLGRLDEVPEDVLGEIAEQLRKVVGEIEPVAGHNGHKSLTSILSLLDEDERRELVGDSAKDDVLIASAMREVEKASRRDLQRGAQQNVQGPPDKVEDQDGEPAATLPFHASESRFEGGAGVGGSQAGNASQVHDEFSSREMMQQIDGTLESLKPKELKILLAKMETRQAILTLCGLSSGQVKRLMKVLPRRQVREVEQRMHGIGALELWEIDQAKVAAVELLTGRNFSAADSRMEIGTRRAA